MITNFTPGPWWLSMDGGQDNKKFAIRSQECRTFGYAPIATVRGDLRVVSAVQREANARLIAAAPDLIAALIEAMPHIEQTEARLMAKQAIMYAFRGGK